MPGVRVCATGTVALMASLAVPVAEVAGSVVRHAMRHDFLPGFPPGQVLGHVGRADLAWIQVALVADRVQGVFDGWRGSKVAVEYWNGAGQPGLVRSRRRGI